MNTNTINTAELRKLAEECDSLDTPQATWNYTQDNYIAAANPSTMLALLDRLEKAEAEKAEMLKTAAMYQDLWSEAKQQLAASQQCSEPVAWMRKTDITELVDWEPETDGWTPLYTHPTAPADKAVLSRGDAGADERDAVIEAARKLVKAKGRYHTELNYKALAEAVATIAAQEKDNG